MTAILLAAGFSRRFGAGESTGSQKLLARLEDGRYVVEAAAQNLLAGAGKVVAVIGADEALKRVLENCGCQVVVNTLAKEGMGTSIAAGVRACRDAGGWLIALGDLPFIQPQTIANILVGSSSSAGIVIPTFNGARGHPVAFAADFLPELMALQGDQGARSIVAAHPARLKLLPVDDAGVVADIDTPDDLRNHQS